MSLELKNILLKIEIAINTGDLDTALSLYEEIDKKWETLSLDLNPESIEELNKIIAFIDSILKEMYENLKEDIRYLQTRRAYGKFT